MRLSARARDSTDEELGDRAVTLDVTLNHAGHEHPLLSQLGGSLAGFQALADHDADSFYRLRVTATDSGGLTATRTVEIRPRVVRFRIASSPSGAPLVYGGRRYTAPMVRRAAAGYATIATTARRFRRRGRLYVFRRWSDRRRARTRRVRVPGRGGTLTAVYRPVRPRHRR